MSRVNRTKLTKKHHDALVMFANNVTPTDTTNPDEFELPTATTDVSEETVVDETEEVEQEEKVEQEANDTTPEEEVDWIDELTTPPPPEPDVTKENVELPSTEQAEGESDEDYIARVREEFKNLEHLDAEIAEEFFDRAVNPIIERNNKRTQDKIDALERELAQVRESTAHLTKEQQQKRYTDLNAPILERHPKANKILQSQEFMEFVNRDTKPFDQETKYQTLSRAYQLGYTDEVIAALDAFVESRGKPKPPVNADGKASSTTATTAKPKRMSEAEFLKQRRAIMANPRKYPQGALRKLELDFFNQK